MSAALERWMKLGADGFVVSIVYGPCGENCARFSVDVMAPDGASFANPFGANSFEHAVEIAELEIAKRGWARQ